MIRTLLVTDLVDSTALAESLGVAAAAELGARHDRLARDLLALHGGLEIDKTDGFLLLFQEPEPAWAYARAYQDALRGLGLAARAGLHVGEVVLRENRPEDVRRGAKPVEVEGVAKALTARVMSVARGGQTLATRAGAPEGARSHGHWRLKGVAEPVELFEVTGDGAPPADAPKAWRVVWKNEAWVPVQEVEHRLPRERDAFVGRSSDLHDLARWLDSGAALVSVVGTGGTGKTRLALHHAWTWLGEYPGGAWFCDLSEARSADGIVSAVATALDVALDKGDPAAQLGDAIARRKRCLVVLDNFEQVSRYASETLGRWLDRAPHAQFVVTTREVLGLPGEVALALPPLPTEEAADLFVARARAAKGDFTPTDAASIEALVRLLDGLPLAIELAAARVRVMAPKVLLERMTSRFRLLTSSGGRHARQATLQATLDWSWDLLSEDERRALARLAVFEGGFSLEAAESVLSSTELWPTDAVQSLVDKSWVRPVAADRFDLLVTVQEYAAAKLEALGERASAEARHGAWFARSGAQHALDALDDPTLGRDRRRELALDLDNLVAACRRAVTRGDAEVAVSTYLASWAVLALRGPFAVAVELGTLAGRLAMPPRHQASVSRVLALALRQSGRAGDALPLYESALARFREAGDRRGEGSVLGDLGGLLHTQGRLAEAVAQYDLALVVHRELGDRRSEGIVLSNLGLACFSLGRVEEARARYEAALAVYREVGLRRSEGVTLGNLGSLLASQGRLDDARARLEAAIVIHREFGDRRYEGVALSNLAALYEELGRAEDAHATYAAALAAHREVGNRRFEGMELGNLGHLQSALGRLDEAAASFAEGERILGDVGDGFQLAKLLCLRVTCDLRRGRTDDAGAALARAESLAAELGAPPDSEVLMSIAKSRAALGRG